MVTQFGLIVQLYQGLFELVSGGVKGLFADFHDKIDSRQYSSGMSLFQQVRAFVQFDLSPVVDVNEEILRCRSLFLLRLKVDCDAANQEVDTDMSNSTDTFNSTLQRVLAVTSLPAFSEFVDMEKVRTVQDSLTDRVRQACDKVTYQFRCMFAEEDSRIFEKVKISSVALDALRVDVSVCRATAEQHRLLLDAVRTALECYRKQAIKLIGVATRQPTNPHRAALGERSQPATVQDEGATEDNPAEGSPTAQSISVTPPLDLKTLLLMLHDASTMHGGLQSAYQGELEEVKHEMKTLVDSFTRQLADGEGGVKLTIRIRQTLNSLRDSRCAVLNLLESIGDDVRHRDIRDLVDVFLLRCDDVVAKAATEGSATKISTMHIAHSPRYIPILSLTLFLLSRRRCHCD